MMKQFPAKCANSSVWILYGRGAGKSGQDGRDLIPIVSSRRDALDCQNAVQSKNLASWLTAFVEFHPTQKDWQDWCLECTWYKCNWKRLGRDVFSLKKVELVLCISKKLFLITEILGNDGDFSPQDHHRPFLDCPKCWSNIYQAKTKSERCWLHYWPNPGPY